MTGRSSEGRIGRYRLVKRLAVGGMADIWIAQEYGARGYERTVVVKTIRGDLVEEDELIHMLVEEARIAACLQHPNIVELFEIGEYEGTHYLAMEFVFGRDLRQIRDLCLERGQRIPYQHIVTIVASVLDALHYAYHEAKYEGRPLRVIHRDVSPQNIIVGFDGTVKLVDFGIAKATAQLSRTRTGVLKGKYGYMAPEQVDLKNLDQRADVFSCGIVLWEMMTQQRLFYRASEYETVQAVLQCRAPSPRAIRRDIPWILSWVCFRALRRHPRWRYGNANQMAAALRAWDRRNPGTANEELAAWMAELYEDDLRQREDALIRERADPTRQRQVRDAGFELIEETTRRDRRPAAGNLSPHETPRRPTPRAREIRVPTETGSRRYTGSVFESWKWFLALFASLLFLCLATGVYIASRHQADDRGYAYVSVDAASPEVEVVIGGRPLGRVPVNDVLVLPGRHRIVGILGAEQEMVEVVVPPGGRETVRLSLPRKKP